jgi:hypothetical protein
LVKEVTMKSVHMAVAVLLVTCGALAIPWSAEASCYVALTTLVNREDLDVVATADAEVLEAEPGGCVNVGYLSHS